MSGVLDEEAEGLAVQYVLGELTPVEVAAFESRLDTEQPLAAEVRRLRATLGALAFATATDPPPSLRDRIVASAAVRERPAPRPRAPRRIVWSRFAAAVAAALALAFGVDAYRVRRELSLERELTATLVEPNVVKSFALAGVGDAGGAYGTVALDMDAKRGAVVLKRMPALPAGRVYRLWAKVGDKDVPCGDFGVAADGQVVAQFRVPVESYTAPLGKLIVSIESPAPSERPTGPIVMESV